MRRQLLGLCVAGAPRAPVAHDVHVSQARVLVDGASIAWRLRVFEDDLERALRAFARDSTLSVAALPAARFDPLVTRYLAARLVVVADGDTLAPALVQTGVDDDPVGGPVRWLVFTYDARRPVTRLVLRHAVLFETYADQQNLVTLQVAGGRRLPLYFSARDDVPQVVPLR